MPDESTTPVMPPVVDSGVVDGAATVAGGAMQTSDTSTMDSGAMTSGGNPPVQDSAIPTTGSDVPVSDGNVATQNGTPSGTAPYDPLANSSVVVTPTTVSDEPVAEVVSSDTPSEIIQKIGESHNVLIAISSDPSVDELASAIGLSIYLDKMGKRATAIYSGKTPNVLEFLKPEETFETTADTLQDFVIALDKEKADHLRYKLDGDYVKIYITPYKHRLSAEDLEYSYGDYNVDLVLALDVANGIDLDEALREHGRIMHDAVIVNITTGNPGKLGEIEWSDKHSSSVSEMIARLLYSIDGDVVIEKEEATAFLTGIVAATNRFSNARTTPDTMRMASRLMESGANQQLVSRNITPDVDNELFMSGRDDNLVAPAEEIVDNDPTKLDIGHGDEENVDETKEVSDEIAEKQSTLLDDLKAAEASLAMTGAEATPDVAEQPVRIEETNNAFEGVNGDSLGGDSVDALQSKDELSGVTSEGNANVGTDVNNVPDNTNMEVPVGGGEATGVEKVDSGDAVPEGGEVGAVSENMAVGDNNITVGGSGAAVEGDGTAIGDNSTVVDGGSAGDSGISDSGFIGGSENSDGGIIESSGTGSGLEEKESEGVGGDEAKVPGSEEGIISTQPEKVIAPPSDFSLDSGADGDDKYSKMLEDALESINNSGVGSDGVGSSNGFGNPAPMNVPGDSGTMSSTGMSGFGGDSSTFNVPSNPAVASAPSVPSNPEINGVPSINYMPMPGDEVLPPPPAPPIDMATPTGSPNASSAMSGVGAEMNLPNNSGMGVSGAGQGVVGAAGAANPGLTAPPAGTQPSDPSAFKIPGM